MMRLFTLTGIATLLTAQSAFAGKSIENIQFKRGGHEKTITSAIRGNDHVDYRLNTSEGQALHIVFSPSRGSCSMNVYEPDTHDGAVFIGETSGNTFTAAPTKTGAYRVQVQQTPTPARRNATCQYSISFELTGGNAFASSNKPLLGAWGVETQYISKRGWSRSAVCVSEFVG